VAGMFHMKEVAIRLDDDMRGWQTVITVESVLGTDDPQEIIFVVPEDEQVPEYERAVIAAREYVRRYFTEKGPQIR
jgi:hypothetical protein